MKPKMCRKARGFTLVELLVVIGIIALLISILLPTLNLARERGNRAKCQSNLHQIGTMLRAYETDYKNYPRTNADATGALVAYTPASGSQSQNPFAAQSGTIPTNNDLTACFWLLARTCDLNPEIFNCASTTDTKDPMLTGSTQMTPATRCNFTGDGYNSYSFYNEYPTPAQITSGMPRWTGSMSSAIAIMADKNPGGANRDPGISATSNSMKLANSQNHSGAGQTVLYADAHAEFKPTPYCGSNNDNIYISGGGSGSSATPADDSNLQPCVNGVIQ